MSSSHNPRIVIDGESGQNLSLTGLGLLQNLASHQWQPSAPGRVPGFFSFPRRSRLVIDAPPVATSFVALPASATEAPSIHKSNSLADFSVGQGNVLSPTSEDHFSKVPSSRLTTRLPEIDGDPESSEEEDQSGGLLSHVHRDSFYPTAAAAAASTQPQEMPLSDYEHTSDEDDEAEETFNAARRQPY
jgi:hypothetical protein